MSKIRYGIIGFGVQGSLYAKLISTVPGLKRDAELVAICDIDEKKREKAKNKYPSAKIYDDFKALIDSKNIDVVMVEVPHYHHAEMAIYALEHGTNVICDKPAGVYTKQVREMNEVAEKHPGLLFSMMYNQRTNPLYRYAKKAIETHDIGDVARIVWIVTDWYRNQRYYDSGGWRGTWNGEGGGVLTNQCPHQLDLFTWLAGQPISVQATVSTINRNISVENDVTAYCKFAGGATGVLITSTHDYPGTNRLEITGTKGKIVIEKGKLVHTRLSLTEAEYNANPDKPVVSETKRYTKATLRLKKEYRMLPEHAGIIANVNDVLNKRSSKLIAPGKEGIVGLTFSNAIYLSGWTGKEVVLPIDEEEYLVELEKKKEQEDISFKNKK